MKQNIVVYICATIVAILIFLLSVSHAYATVTPSFPSCLNPQGSVKVEYASGVHGVVGKPGVEYTGRDVVYSLSEDTLMQCLCPSNGQGIQTNWWKVSNLTDPEIQSYIYAGWQYVSNGAAWGLESAPYLAKNAEYSCIGGMGGGGSAGVGGGPGTSSSSNGSSNSNPIGSVLGLASTGNLALIYGFAVVGLFLLVVGLVSERIIISSKK